METNIISQQKNEALSRNQVIATLIFEGATPSRKDIQKEVAKKTKGKENLTVIKTVNTAFGEAKAKVTAHVYSDEKVMLNNERKNLVEKHTGHEPKKE
ncbi:MAG: hypothetical protein ACOCZV_02435, partial [Nanoarchaeota archaeon]